MKINSATRVSSAYNNYSKLKPKKSGYDSKESLDIEISQTGKDFAYAMEKLKEIEPVRKGKVENIKNAISNGSYIVDSAKIAKAMLLGEIND